MFLFGLREDFVIKMVMDEFGVLFLFIIWYYSVMKNKIIGMNYNMYIVMLICIKFMKNKFCICRVKDLSCKC